MYLFKYFFFFIKEYSNEKQLERLLQLLRKEIKPVEGERVDNWFSWAQSIYDPINRTLELFR